MTTLWTYPWTMCMEGPEEACRDLAERGVGSFAVASQYHSIRSINPRFPDNLFTTYRSGCYFSPNGHFAETELSPPVTAVDGFEDPLEEIVSAAQDHDLSATAWLVCLHNTGVGTANPSYRIESAFGDAHDHAVCPSHPDVRRYVVALVKAVCDRGVDAVQLESIGYQSAFHHHWAHGGHEKQQVLDTDTGKALLSQCFCDACVSGAQEHGVDIERAREAVRNYLRARFDTPHSEGEPIDEFLDQHPSVADLFEYRRTVIERMVRDAAAATDDQPVSYTILSEADRPGSGIRIESFEDVLESVVSLCYVGDPAEAKERVRQTKSVTDATVDAGVGIDPGRFDEREEFERVVEAVREETDGELFVYNRALLAESQLEWVEAVL